MRIAIAALIALLPCAANAEIFQDKDGSAWLMAMPPNYYRSANRDIEIRRHILPRRQVEAECKHLTGKDNQYGCAQLWPRACDIFIADDLPQPFFDATDIHETAHCHGWPADHP